MATYEYGCKHCGHVTEKKGMSIKEDVRTVKCESCGKEAGKIMSQTSFKLEGGGWYKDGYGSKP